MKKLISLCAALTLLTGCAIVPKAVISITNTVDYAMKEYSKAAVAGMTTSELDAKVVKAHDDYRDALLKTRLALEAYQAATGQQGDTLAAIRVLRDKIEPLMALIYPAITPAQAQTIKANLDNVNAL